MTDTDTTPSPRNHDDEVDLRAYAFVLTAWWREIVLGAVSFAVGTAALVLAGRAVFPTYETSVDVTVIRMATQVSMDQTLQTGGGQRELRNLEWTARRAALVGLVHNADVAQAVAERLRGQLEEKETMADRLLQRIDTELITIGMLTNRNLSDLIRITARGDSPEQAVAVADAWSEEYVNHVNRLYEQVPETLTASISTAVANAQQAYDTAQARLETFVASSEIDRLDRQIGAKTTTLGNLQGLWRVNVDTQLMAVEKQQDTAFQTVNEWFDSQFQELATNYDTRRKINLLLADARGLRGQIENGGEASVASNGLAFLLLKTAAYASSVSSANLEISLADGGAVHVDAEQQLEDVNAIIGALEVREQQLARDIERQSRLLSNASLPAEEIRDATSGFAVAEASNGQGLGNETEASNGQGLGDEAREVVARIAAINGVNQPLPVQAVSWAPSHLESLADYIGDEQGPVVNLIAAEEEELRALRAERERQTSEQRALTRERDLRWSALSSLQSERVELELSSFGNVSEVRLASRAAAPSDPVGLAVPLIAALAGFIGLLAMVCLAFFADAVGGRPWLHEWRAARGVGAR